MFLSRDAREALAEYLETERPRDASAESGALFLSAAGAPARRADGRLSVRAINLLLERIGRWHDAEVNDSARKISPLQPHDLRHTFAYRLAAETGKDAYELERGSGTAPSDTSNATPTRPRTWRPATWKDSERIENGRSAAVGTTRTSACRSPATSPYAVRLDCGW